MAQANQIMLEAKGRLQERYGLDAEGEQPVFGFFKLNAKDMILSAKFSDQLGD